MELDVWQLQKIIKAAAKEAVSEYAISKDPVIDEITETQAIRLGDRIFADSFFRGAA